MSVTPGGLHKLVAFTRLHYVMHKPPSAFHYTVLNSNPRWYLDFFQSQVGGENYEEVADLRLGVKEVTRHYELT